MTETDTMTMTETAATSETRGLSIAMLRQHGACDLGDRIADITTTLGRRPDEDEELPVPLWWGLATTSVTDRWWSLRCLGGAGRRVGVAAACRAARRVLPLVRERDRGVCQVAIETAERRLRGEATAAECGAANAAANAAYADDAAAVANAAYAAYATYAAANAATAVAVAARVVADVAATAARVVADVAATAADVATADDAAAAAATATAAERGLQAADLDELWALEMGESNNQGETP